MEYFPRLDLYQNDNISMADPFTKLTYLLETCNYNQFYMKTSYMKGPLKKDKIHE